jgi:hypothetical protein
LLTGNEWLRSSDAGIVLRQVKPGQEVRAGQKLGELANWLGRYLEDVTSPAGGVILFAVTRSGDQTRRALAGGRSARTRLRCVPAIAGVIHAREVRRSNGDGGPLR